nr:PLP-dependent aminotransferase family protein [Arthrobacter sp. H14]
MPGSQSGLSSIFRALAGSGHPVLMESPTYWGAILAASHAGVDIIPVPSGAEGPDPAELARAFEESGARLFYAQPNYANPTGAQWSHQRGEQVLEVVRQNGAFLIEDDWAHDFGISTTAVPIAAREDSGHVIYLRSLTKSVSPAMRVGAVIARGPARDRILADRGAESMYVSGILQTAALDVITQPAWQTHLRGLRHQLQSRRDLLVTSLRQHAPQVHVAHLPKGGLNLWARLPDGTDLDRFIRECESAGVIIAPGTEWFPAEPAGPFIRLNYAGPNPGAFQDGAHILNRSLERISH